LITFTSTPAAAHEAKAVSSNAKTLRFFVRPRNIIIKADRAPRRPRKQKARWMSGDVFISTRPLRVRQDHRAN
jgi:hypothetical protein